MRLVADTAGPFSVGGQDQAAANVVLGYFGAINARDHQGTYAALGSQLQAQQSYSVIVTGVAIGAGASPGTFPIGLRFSAQQVDGLAHSYGGTYTVGAEDRAFRIVAAHVAAGGR